MPDFLAAMGGLLLSKGRGPTYKGDRREERERKGREYL